MGPTWGPPRSCRPHVGPMLAPWALLSGLLPNPTVDRSTLVEVMVWCRGYLASQQWVLHYAHSTFCKVGSFDCLFFRLFVRMEDLALLTKAFTNLQQLCYTALSWVSTEPYWFSNWSTKYTCQNVSFRKSSPLRVRFNFAVTLIIHRWTPAQRQPYCSGIRTVLNTFYVT